jgi:WD40 repeat protein
MGMMNREDEFSLYDKPVSLDGLLLLVSLPVSWIALLIPFGLKRQWIMPILVDWIISGAVMLLAALLISSGWLYFVLILSSVAGLVYLNRNNDLVSSGVLAGVMLVAGVLFAVDNTGGDSASVKRLYAGGHQANVLSVSLSGDGRRLASGDGDGRVVVWDVAARRSLYAIDAHSRGVRAVSFFPKNRRLLTASWDRQVKVHDVTTGKTLWRVEDDYNLTAGAVSPIGDVVLVGNNKGSIVALDAADGKRIAEFEGHSHDVVAISFSSDAKFAISGSGDKTAKIWDMSNGKLIKTLGGHKSMIAAVSFSPDGKLALTGDRFGKVVIWDLANTAPKSRFSVSGQITDGCFSPDGDLVLLSIAAPAKVELRDAASGEVEDSIRFTDAEPRVVAFSPDGESYFVALGKNVERFSMP